MQNKFAQWISILLHPLLMPTVGVIVLLNSDLHVSFLPWEIKKLIYLLVILGTFIIPLCFIPFFLYQKIIASIEMTERKERLIPLFFTSIFYFFSYFLFTRIELPNLLQLFILSSAISVFICFLITIKWKISAHLLGIGGLTGGVLAVGIKFDTDIRMILTILFLAAGILAYARLKLKAHNQAQVYTGYFTGFIIMLLIIIFV